MRKYEDAEWLRQKYWDEQLSLRDVAALANTSNSVIRRWMLKFGIATRAHKNACCTEKSRIQRTASQIEANKDPKVRERKRRASKKCWQDPEYQEHVSQGLREAWQDENSGWHTPEYRQGMSECMTETWRSGALDILRSEWWGEKKSRDTKASWDNGVYDTEEWKQSMTAGLLRYNSEHEVSPERRARISKGVKRAWARGDFDGKASCPNPSGLAKKVIDALQGLGYQIEIELRLRSYYYDIYIPALNLLCEVDGWFWHHSEWAQERGAPERDAIKDQVAKEEGYRLIRFGERELKRIGIRKLVKSRIGGIA